MKEITTMLRYQLVNLAKTQGRCDFLTGLPRTEHRWLDDMKSKDSHNHPTDLVNAWEIGWDQAQLKQSRKSK